MPQNTKEIRHAYKSKYNLNRENQVILLMIVDGEKWHDLAVKCLSTLFRGITSKHKGEFYCLNCFCSYGEKWHYIAVKCLSALFRGITSKHKGEFYCLNCFCSYITENKFKKHKKVCENHEIIAM